MEQRIFQEYLPSLIGSAITYVLINKIIKRSKGNELFKYQGREFHLSRKYFMIVELAGIALTLISNPVNEIFPFIRINVLALTTLFLGIAELNEQRTN